MTHEVTNRSRGRGLERFRAPLVSCHRVCIAAVVVTFLTGLPWLAAATPLRIERITVAVDDIYAASEVAGSRGLVRVVRRSLNALHVDTRERIIRRELLFAPGDTLDAARLAETERNLRGLGYLTEVSVAVGDTLAGGGVEVRVRARETWSLQPQLAYARSSDGEQRWSVAAGGRELPRLRHPALGRRGARRGPALRLAGVAQPPRVRQPVARRAGRRPPQRRSRHDAGGRTAVLRTGGPLGAGGARGSTRPGAALLT